MEKNKLDVPKYLLAVFSRQCLGMFLPVKLLEEELQKYDSVEASQDEFRWASIAVQLVAQLRMFSDERIMIWDESYRDLKDMLVFAGLNGMLKDAVQKSGKDVDLRKNVQKIIGLNDKYNVLKSDEEATSKKIRKTIEDLEHWLNQVEAIDGIITAIADVTDYDLFYRLRTSLDTMDVKRIQILEYNVAFREFVTLYESEEVKSLKFLPIMRKTHQQYESLGDIRDLIYKGIKDFDSNMLALGNLINFVYPAPSASRAYYSFGRF